MFINPKQMIQHYFHNYFQTQAEKITFDFKVKLDGKRLVFQDCVNYLGSLIDSQLNWSHHQEKVTKSPRQTNGVL